MLSLRILCLGLVLPGMAMAESFYWGGQMSLTEIRETTADTSGNFGYGSGYWNNYKSFMNANGCSTATWRPCSMSDIRQAYANRVTGWNTIAGGSFSCSWIVGHDVSVIKNYDTLAPTTTNCLQWTSALNTNYGMAFCPPETTTGSEFGFVIMPCNRLRKLLCCR